MKGFSVVEIILASAIFLVFSSGSIFVTLHGFSVNRLSEEQMIANQFASEGIEAVKSIKNQAYSSLVDTAGTGLIRNGSNVWAFSGTNNTFSAGKTYTRVIKVESVGRDATPPTGNILVAGTPDPDTKKITSTVSWNFNSSRPESVVLTTYLTNWRAVIAASGNNGSGIAIYGDTATVAQPRYRIYTTSTNAFGSEAGAGSGFTDTVVGKTFKLKTSPTKQEAIAGYVNNNGQLRIMCFDGTTWTSDWTVAVGGTGTNDQRFGIAYEQTTGDVLVVHSTNTATTNEMAYRTKLGSTSCGSANWSSATNIDAVRTSGIIHWIRMESSPVSGSNTIGIAWADASSDLSAMEWTGASFGVAEPAAALETELERVAASQDVQSFDIAFESLTGNFMVVWGLNQATTCTAGTAIAVTNCIRYARYASGVWSALAAIPTVADPATNIDISSNPNSNELVLAALDNNQADLSSAYWSGTTWTGRANIDTTTQAAVAGSKLVATGWLTLGATTQQVVVYNDATTTNLGFYTATGTAALVARSDWTPSPAFANPQKWYDIQPDPENKDRFIFTLSDNNSDLFAKRAFLTINPIGFAWSNADSGAALETGLGQGTTSPYGFAFWKNPPTRATPQFVRIAPGVSNDAAATTIATTFATTNAGNLIVAAFSWEHTATIPTPTCTDTQGNKYTTITTQFDSTNGQLLGICYASNIVGGANNIVTVTFGGSRPFRRLHTVEYSGIATVSPVDVVATNVANGTTAANNITSTAATTGYNGDLIFGAVMDTTSTNTSITAGTSVAFNQRAIVTTDFAVQDYVQPTAGSIASTQTFGTAHRYIAHMVAFKAAPQ